MGRDVLSVRQMMILLAVALLGPAADLLPTLAAGQVGRGGWLVAAGALPVLLIALWSAAKVFCGRGIRAQLGRPAGYTIIIMYLFWVLLTLTVTFRLSAARTEAVGGSDLTILFALTLAAMAVWMGTGKAAALARAAEIFYLALSVVLVGVLILAALNMERKNLYPMEWSAVPYGSLSAAGMLLNIVPAAVLGRRIPQKNRSGKRACGWVIAFSIAAAMILAAVIGSVGPGLSARLEIPYLIMVQGLGIKGGFQRMEALVAALWMLSDLILAGMLVRAWCDYAEELHPGEWSRWSSVPAVVVALAAGWFLFPEGDDAQNFCRTFMPAIGIGLGLIVPLLGTWISTVRMKKKR